MAAARAPGAHPLPSACRHCGEALPREASRHAVDPGDGHAYCCDGCAAAAQWIRDANLDDYYRLRTAAAGRVGTDAIDLSAWDRADLQREHASATDDGLRITLLTDGMRCAACAWLIQ
ncbi:MAG: heavy metal translocating P-type ATPase metal-binding domain-containing protein, partial [Luteimonas sp.]|nr:heavy metal translocating P-type ATPase metal-binding domain-containing protein [Luteimonas sp.]